MVTHQSDPVAPLGLHVVHPRAHVVRIASEPALPPRTLAGAQTCLSPGGPDAVVVPHGDLEGCQGVPAVEVSGTQAQP